MLAKSKLNSRVVLISKALTDSVISHNEFVLIKKCSKRILRNERRNQKIKDLIKLFDHFSLFIKQCYQIVWSVEKTQKVKIQKLQGQKMEEWFFYQNA